MNKKLIGLISLSAILLMGSECEQSKKIREDFFISTTSEYSTSTPTTSTPRVPPLLVLDEDPDFLPSVSSSSVHVIYDTTSTEPTLFYGPPEVTSTKKYSSSTSSIDKNDPKTWPRFEFKELGFSMQLPFEKERLNYFFGSYKLGENNLNINENNLMFLYQGEMGTSRGQDYVFLGARSQNYNQERGGLFDVKDLKLGKNPEILLFKESMRNEFLKIKPVKTLSISGTKIILFNSSADFFNKFENFDIELANERQRWAFTFKLPSSKHFKAVLFNFYEKDISYSNLIIAIQTIKFE